MGVYRHFQMPQVGSHLIVSGTDPAPAVDEVMPIMGGGYFPFRRFVDALRVPRRLPAWQMSVSQQLDIVIGRGDHVT